jgi:hypothetical protein
MTAFLVLIIGSIAGAIVVLIPWLVVRALNKWMMRPSKTSPMIKSAKLNLEKEKRIKYELDIDDVLVFYSYHYQRPPLGRSRIFRRYILLGSAPIFIIIAAVLWLFMDEQSILTVTVMIMGVLGLFYGIFSPLFTRKLLRSGVLKTYGQGKNRLIGKHEFSINPTEMKDKTDMGETTTCWDAIDYVEATDQYIFLTVRGSGHYIVPKKAFSNNEAFKQFAETATAYYQVSVAQQAEIQP